MRMLSFQTLEHPKLSMLFLLGWRLASLELALNTQQEAFTGWLRRFCLVHPMVEGLTFGHSVARFWKLRVANILRKMENGTENLKMELEEDLKRNKLAKKLPEILGTLIPGATDLIKLCLKHNKSQRHSPKTAKP